LPVRRFNLATNGVASMLYHGKSRHQIISSASLAILAFFYVYSAASEVSLRIYPLVDRVTYYTVFHVFIISEFADHIVLASLLIIWLIFALPRSRIRDYGLIAFGITIVVVAIRLDNLGLDIVALTSLPVITIVVFCDMYLIVRARKTKTTDRGILKEPDYELALNYMAVVGIVLAAITLFLAMIPITTGQNSQEVFVRMYAYDVFLILSSFAPVFMLLLLACFPLLLLISPIQQFLRKDTGITGDSIHAISKKKRIIILFLTISISLMLTSIPHLPTLNESGQQVGVDTGAYVNWITELDDTSDFRDFLKKTFLEQSNGDRPFPLILLFGLHSLVNVSPFLVVEYSTFVLVPALVVVTYFLTRQITQNELASLIAAFLTSVSFQTLVGIYAGFYANLIALVIGYLSLAFLFRFLKKGGFRNLLLFGSLLLLTLFSHVYTWSILTIVVGLFLVILVAKPRYSNVKRKSILLLIVGLIFSVAVDMARIGILEVSSGIDSDLRLAAALTGVEQFLQRWNNLYYAITTYLGGLFANFIILGLGLYWLIKADIRNQTSIFIMIFLSLGILPFLIGEYTIQTRVLYDIPFQIPAAIALTRSIIGKNILRPAAILFWIVVVSVIALSNYFLVSPIS
jgi:hypothetical protein